LNGEKVRVTKQAVMVCPHLDTTNAVVWIG